jgi:hypothetical protein
MSVFKNLFSSSVHDVANRPYLINICVCIDDDADDDDVAGLTMVELNVFMFLLSSVKERKNLSLM